jgi:hypothetical protein
MSKIKRAMFIAAVVSSVGVSYALYTLRGLPETFEWEDDDEQFRNFED